MGCVDGIGWNFGGRESVGCGGDEVGDADCGGCVIEGLVGDEM